MGNVVVVIVLAKGSVQSNVTLMEYRRGRIDAPYFRDALNTESWSVRLEWQVKH
jgi:hypothetical protein